MTTPLNIPKKGVLNIRHTPEVKAFLDEKAAEQNLQPSTMYRNVVNAGLEAMYGLKIHNNQIVQRNP